VGLKTLIRGVRVGEKKKKAKEKSTAQTPAELHPPLNKKWSAKRHRRWAVRQQLL
jgi:hypothetical protein